VPPGAARTPVATPLLYIGPFYDHGVNFSQTSASFQHWHCQGTCGDLGQIGIRKFPSEVQGLNSSDSCKSHDPVWDGWHWSLLASHVEVSGLQNDMYKFVYVVMLIMFIFTNAGLLKPRRDTDDAGVRYNDLLRYTQASSIQWRFVFFYFKPLNV